MEISIDVHLIFTLNSDTNTTFVKLNFDHRLIHILYFQRPVMYGIVIGGWTVGIYLLQLVWENLRLIIIQYQTHVLYYVVFTGFVSFVVCYRLGPVTDQRSKNLIKWALQVLINVCLESYEVKFNYRLISVMCPMYIIHKD